MMELRQKLGDLPGEPAFAQPRLKLIPSPQGHKPGGPYEHMRLWLKALFLLFSLAVVHPAARADIGLLLNDRTRLVGAAHPEGDGRGRTNPRQVDRRMPFAGDFRGQR